MPFMPLSTEGWLPPVRVLLHAKPGNSLRHPAVPAFRCRIANMPGESTETGRLTKPSEKILEEFIALRGQSDKDVLDSPSLRSYRTCMYRQDASDADITIEYCDVWRYFARSMKALLSLKQRCHLCRGVGSAEIGRNYYKHLASSLAGVAGIFWLRKETAPISGPEARANPEIRWLVEITSSAFGVQVDSVRPCSSPELRSSRNLGM